MINKKTSKTSLSSIDHCFILKSLLMKKYLMSHILKKACQPSKYILMLTFLLITLWTGMKLCLFTYVIIVFLFFFFFMDKNSCQSLTYAYDIAYWKSLGNLWKLEFISLKKASILHHQAHQINSEVASPVTFEIKRLY